MHHEIPRVSIITSTYNAGKTLSRLADSMRSQSLDNIEWIVIDGGSTDSTKEIIQSNSDIIKFWSSKKDSGIYEAWNKGLIQASGQFVGFLGADDQWASNESLAELYFLCKTRKADFGSAKVDVIDSSGVILRQFGSPWSKNSMLNMDVVAHPGMLVSRSLFSSLGNFNQKFKIAGDYEWLLRIPQQSSNVFHDKVLVKMAAGGISQRSIIPIIREVGAARELHTNESIWTKYFFLTKLFAAILINEYMSKFRLMFLRASKS